MTSRTRIVFMLLIAGAAAISAAWIRAAGAQTQTPLGEAAAKVISAEDCAAAKLGSSIPVSAIGEPVAGVTLAAPRWVDGNGNAPAYCSIEGVMAPVDTSASGRPINFRIVLPA